MMPRLQRRRLLRTSLLAPALAMPALAARAQGAPVLLRAVSAFQEGTAFAKPFETWMNRVNEQGAGKVRIQFVGGPRAIPPFEIGNAIRTGVVDIANTTASFYTNLSPEADAFKLTQRPMDELRRNGGWEAMNRILGEKVNAVHLARMGESIPFHLYLNRELAGPDLKGLTIRVSPTYRAFFTALGANLVNTAPGEVLTALERNVVQGYGWPATGIFDLGWHERTKFRVDPGFYQVEVSFLANLTKWRALPEEVKALLTRLAVELEDEQRQSNKVAVEAEYRRQEAAGIKAIAFQGADRETWLREAYAQGWREIETASPTQGPELRRLFSA